ncbi:MAG: glycosyltransferase [Planctomycetaceae bacterium]|nr:glycosyltransferase [Planctomycetaceae bacterium]MCB9952022.1 glycosyltransferase [Planctomycetaceae bacterium]
MRVLVNALSLGWLSGKHVLFGHLRQLAKWSAGKHEFLLLHRADTSINELSDLPNVSGIVAPGSAAHWTTRMAWEFFSLPRLMTQQGVDTYFTPTGTILPRSPVPQVTLAQNPWCMMPGLQRGASEKFKAWLQRRAYRKAFRSADLMVYNSQHMRDLYQSISPGLHERNQLVAYQGIDDETHDLAAQSQVPRIDHRILAVSVMAHWKGAEVVVAAVAGMKKRGVDAELKLVGPWADMQYRSRVEAEIAAQGVSDRVEIAGQVTREELHQHYASARVFCLMSRCESFGIPAVEAQAFGTPVVGSSVCAMPEIGGEGGHFVSPDNVSGVADALQKLLTDSEHWIDMSQRAKTNAAKYRWDECSRPLMKIFDLA